jgi:hypothetical protein
MPRQNKDTPELALSFAKEILGWEDAEISDRQSEWFILRAEVNRKSPDIQWIFGFSQIDVVVSLVQEWCDENQHQFGISYRDNCYAVEIGPEDSTSIVQCGPEKHLCHALMSACLDAHRRNQGRGNFAAGAQHLGAQSN